MPNSGFELMAVTLFIAPSQFLHEIQSKFENRFQFDREEVAEFIENWVQ